MAITGTFAADFAQFNDAVQNAEVRLKGFEGNSAKVETALSRMTNSFSGTKVISEATLMAEAVERVGGAAALTAKEQAQVNTVVTEAIAKYEALGQVAPESMRELEEQTRKNVSVTETLKAHWQELTVAAGAVALGVRGVATEVSGWVSAASDQEGALKKLETAMRAQGTFTPDLLDTYKAMADEFQRTSVHADELTNEMQAMLVQVGDVAPEKMREALQAAMDLAAGLGMELPQATMMIGKAISGDDLQLGKLKQLLGDSIEEGAGFEEMLAAITDRFGGQAAAAASTYAGRMTIVKNTMGEAEEKAGDLVMKALAPLAEAFLSMPESMQTTIAAIAMFASVAAPLGMAIGGISTAVGVLMPLLGAVGGGAGLTAALTAVGTTLAALLGPIALVVAAVGGLYLAFKNWDAISGFVSGVYNSVREWLVDRFARVRDGVRAHVDAVLGFFRNLPARGLEYVQQFYEGIYDWLVGRLGRIVEGVKGFTESITGFFGNMYDKVVGHSYVPEMVNGIASEMGRLDSVMVQPAIAATTATTDAFAAMAEAATASAEQVARVTSGGFGAGAGGPGQVGGSGQVTLTNFAGMSTEWLRTMAERIGPSQGWVGAGGQVAQWQWDAITEELRRREFGGGGARGGSGSNVTVNVNASNSFYDTPESVNRLADKVGTAVLSRVAR